MTDNFFKWYHIWLNETIHSESEKILQEAAAENSVVNRLPSMPTNTKTSTKNKFF